MELALHQKCTSIKMRTSCAHPSLPPLGTGHQRAVHIERDEGRERGRSGGGEEEAGWLHEALNVKKSWYDVQVLL